MVNNEVRERRSASHAEKRASKKPILKNMATQPKKLTFLKKNTWIVPQIVLLAFYMTYCFYGSKNPNHWLNWCLKLSYRVPGTELYDKGKRDWAFFAFHVVFFTWLREFCMQVALKPISLLLGLTTKHKVNRFLEQAYSLLYYGVTGPVGLYIMKVRCPELWYFNTTAFYEGFPHRQIDVWMKAFYLLQAAFWGQQALVLLLRIEKPRKDFKELVFHHIVTVALIWLSYRFHFTNMGLAVYITMDVSDFFLALSKILNYLESSAVGVFFLLFVVVWIYLRHYVNIVILYSVATEFRTVGPWELNWDTQQYKCWISQPITFTLLMMLQLVNLYWLALVLRIAYRFLKDNVKEDVRSEDEDEEVVE